MMDPLTISPQAEQALQRLQDTELSPMEEALFKAWAKANDIAKPDDPKDVMDYRGIWKESRGLVLPKGELKQMAETKNHEHTLERELQQRMMDRISEITGSKEDLANKKFDAEQKGLDHDRKMRQGEQQLKKAPFDLKMREEATKGKELDIQKGRVGLDAQKLGNEGKQIDLIASMMQPKGVTQPKPTKA